MPSAQDEKTPVRGLEGVIAADTSISYVDGIHGRLFYQGYDIHDIAEAMSFSETVFLLWSGRCPPLLSIMSFVQRSSRRCACPAR